MGKKAKKNEVRAPGQSITQAKKNKFKIKQTTGVQDKAVNDAVTRGLQGISIFEQLNEANQKGQTKTLMALSAASLTNEMPTLDMFYDPRMLARVLELANQLQHSVNLMALDAIRNLFIQANLIDRPQYAQLILDAGLFATLEEIIGKAIKQLQFDRDHPAEDNNTRTRQTMKEEYQLVVEQSFIVLSDVCHFVEHGQVLQNLTQSQLVVKSMQLVRNCLDFGDILTARVFKQVSVFLRELSNDNEFTKSLDLADFSAIVENAEILPVTPENVDFVWNIAEFYFNVITEKEGSIGVFSKLPLYLGKIAQLMGTTGQESAKATDPVIFFKTNLMPQYKMADMFMQNASKNLTVSEDEVKGMLSENMGQDGEEEGKEITMQELDDEDQVAKTEPKFGTWLANLLAQTNCMRIILKMADYLDTSKVGGDAGDIDDEEFEDCEDMDDEATDTASAAQVIDLDQQKQQCLQAVFGLLDHVLLRSQPIPQLIGLQRQAGDALDELQETSFAVLTSLLFSEMPQVKEALRPRTNDILQAIMNFIQLATYKCERPSSENAAECLSALASFSEESRKAILDHENLIKASQFAVYMPQTAVMAKLYMIQTFAKVLVSSNQTVPVLVCQDTQVISEVTNLLVESCKVNDLVLLSGALDAFYDIFSEELYNQTLLENNVIQQMAQGAPGLQQLYLKCKQEKLLSKSELMNAENALENLTPFVEYKKNVMNLQF